MRNTFSLTSINHAHCTRQVRRLSKKVLVAIFLVDLSFHSMRLIRREYMLPLNKPHVIVPFTLLRFSPVLPEGFRKADPIRI